MALARALVNRPKVLLLDEPLGALDLKLRENMQEELKTLQKALGITFIFVTHDQGEALSMADRVAVFNDGRIMQVGTPRGDLLSARRRASSPISSARPTCCRRISSSAIPASAAGPACGRRAIAIGRAAGEGVAGVVRVAQLSSAPPPASPSRPTAPGCNVIVPAVDIRARRRRDRDARLGAAATCI